MQNELLNETSQQIKSPNLEKQKENSFHIWTVEHENKKNNFYIVRFL